MNSCILLVFEGEKPEKMIHDNVKRNFFSEKQEIVFTAYNAEIFQLWNWLKENYNGDTAVDLIEILKERGNLAVENMSRDNVTEIHLFFDHDAHSHLDTMSIGEYNNVISEMLNYFCDEYYQGKLWISYPMAEALRHCKKNPGSCFENCVVAIDQNTGYKELVGNLSDYLDIRKLDTGDWYYFIAIAMQKANCLQNGDCATPPYRETENFDQAKIHENQIAKFINTETKVAVLSAFPLFLLYFFGEPLYKETHTINKDCQFRCLCKSTTSP